MSPFILFQWQNIEFINTWAFALLLLPPLTYWLAPPHKQQKDSLQVPYFDRLVALSGDVAAEGAIVARGHAIQTFLVCLTWFLLVLSAARPEWVGEPIEIERSARDLMIAVDLSGSMEATDFTTDDGQSVNRLQAVKYVLGEFAQRREGDRLGLIVFGDAAYLQAPFTDDKDTWLTLLDETEIAMAGPSTAMGDAIGLAISTFESSDTDNRVLILLTDGNDTGSKVPPIDAAKIAEAYDVKVYTIGIGDPQTIGEEALDVGTLNRIADITHGSYYEALDRESLSAAYQDIEALEPQLYESLSYRPRSSLFHYPLAFIVLVYLVALPALMWKGLFGRRKQAHD